MKGRTVFSCVVGLHGALAAAALLWALHVRFGDPLTAALCPAWDSPWEAGKGAFFPLLAAAPVMWYLGRGGSRSGLCAMAMAGSGAAMGLRLAGVPAAAAMGLAMAAGAALYGGALRRMRERAGWAAAVMALAAAYILLTLLRPGGALFLPADTAAGTIGF